MDNFCALKTMGRNIYSVCGVSNVPYWIFRFLHLIVFAGSYITVKSEINQFKILEYCKLFEVSNAGKAVLKFRQ